MAFNASGTFLRIHNWITDKVNQVPVTASRMDAEMDGFATGLSTAICKDGQTTTTARIPFGSGTSAGVGSSSAAAYGFANDANTGLYSPGSDQWAMVAGGVGIMTGTTTGVTVDIPAVTQNAATGGGDLTFFNGVTIDDWNVTDTSGGSDAIVIGSGCQITVDGSGVFTPNGTFALAGDILVDTIATASVSGNTFVGVLGRAIARESTTGGPGTYIGAMNANVAIDAGVTGWSTASSLELDMTCLAGSTVGSKYGLAIVLGPGDEVHGSSEDAAIALFNHPNNSASTDGWKYGIKFDQDSRNVNVITSTGTLIGVSGFQTAANGIDLYNWEFTGYAWHSRNLKLTGNTTANSATAVMIVGDSNPATATAGTSYQSKITVDGLAYAVDIGSTDSSTIHFAGQNGVFMATGASVPFFIFQGSHRAFLIDASGNYSMNGLVVIEASTTAHAALRIVQGSAPTSPVDGDIWREDNTNTGLKVRINNVTKTIVVS